MGPNAVQAEQARRSGCVQEACALVPRVSMRRGGRCAAGAGESGGCAAFCGQSAAFYIQDTVKHLLL